MERQPVRRLAATAALSVFALALAFVKNDAPAWLCAAAMLLSSTGDVLLMSFRPVTDRVPHPFEAGAACFMAAHLVYAGAFLARVRFPAPNAGTAAAAAVFVLALLVLAVFSAAGKKRGVRGAPLLLGALYLAVIASNLAAVFTAASAAGGTLRWAALGAALFFLSDTLIGADKIAGAALPHMTAVIWVLYPAGQILLLAGCAGG